LDTLGLAHIAIKRATYAGRAASGIDVDGEEWNEHVYRLRALPTKTRLKMMPMYDFDRLDALSDDVLSELELPPSATNCGAGTAKVYIYTNGDVCPCTCFKDRPMGNLCLSDLDAILARPPTIQVEHPLQRVSLFRAMSWRLLGKRLSIPGQSEHPMRPKVASTGGNERSFILTTCEGLAGCVYWNGAWPQEFMKLRIRPELAGGIV
jgi:hypothetical protein